jgi:hypothetical protein
VGSGKGSKYKFTVLGRYNARLRGNEPHVTVNLLAGCDDHLVYYGNLTMSEAEWAMLSDVLRRGLRDDLEIDDHRRRRAEKNAPPSRTPSSPHSSY